MCTQFRFTVALVTIVLSSRFSDGGGGVGGAGGEAFETTVWAGPRFPPCTVWVPEAGTDEYLSTQVDFVSPRYGETFELGVEVPLEVSLLVLPNLPTALAERTELCFSVDTMPDSRDPFSSATSASPTTSDAPATCVPLVGLAEGSEQLPR